MHTPPRPFALTRHAAERLRERSRIPDEATLNARMQRGFAPNYPLDADTAVWLFWSPEDEWGYLAIFNRYTREIISLMRAYEFRNGKFFGALYWECDIYRKLNLPGQRKTGYKDVRRRDIRYCLQRLGLPVPPEFQPDPKPEEQRKGVLYKLRLLSLDGQSKTKTLLKDRGGDLPGAEPPPAVLDKARLVIGHDRDRYASVCIEATELVKKPDLRFASFIRDWELDPGDF